MEIFKRSASTTHEQVVFCNEPSCGYKGIIAIHDTTLGPALGGTRFWNYASDDEAIVDALRLVARDDLQGGGRRAQPGRRQVGHHRRPEDHAARDDLPRPRPLRREPRGPLHHRRGRRHLRGRHGLREHGDGARHRPLRHLRRPLARSPPSASTAGIKAGGEGEVRLRRPRGEDGGGAGRSGTSATTSASTWRRRAPGSSSPTSTPERVRRVVDEFDAEAVKPDAIYSCRPTSTPPARSAPPSTTRRIPQLKVGHRRRCGQQRAGRGAPRRRAPPPRHPLRPRLRDQRRRPDQRLRRAQGLDPGAVDAQGRRDLRRRSCSLFELASEEGIPTYEAADRIAEQRIESVARIDRTWV